MQAVIGNEIIEIATSDLNGPEALRLSLNRIAAKNEKERYYPNNRLIVLITFLILQFNSEELTAMRR